MKSAVVVLVVLFNLSAVAQLKISNVEKLPLDKTKEWSSPIFSPDGKRIYFTTSSYQGIWEYIPATKKQRLITDDARSGFGFVVSADGKNISYRRTINGQNPQGRAQEIVVRELSGKGIQVVASGSNLSTPVYSGNNLLFSINNQTSNLSAISVAVLGIEDTKIGVVVNGAKKILDPLKNGSYIWPMLSPDGKKLVASDMARGTFVCDLKGNALTKLGKRNAAVWTRDGRWLIYMNDKDDGHNIISSDLLAVSSDGRRGSQLTFTKDEIEMYPQCSPIENKIVCSTLDGEIVLMTYVEGK